MKKLQLDQKVYEAMVNFQYLEFMLKGAIIQFESIIARKVSDVMQYQVNDSKINKLGLSKLAELYSQYTGDNNFNKRINDIISSRNRLAHVLFIKAEYLGDQKDIKLDDDIDEVLKHSMMADNMADEVIMYMQNQYNPAEEDFEEILHK